MNNHSNNLIKFIPYMHNPTAVLEFLLSSQKRSIVAFLTDFIEWRQSPFADVTDREIVREVKSLLFGLGWEFSDQFRQFVDDGEESFQIEVEVFTDESDADAGADDIALNRFVGRDQVTVEWRS